MKALATTLTLAAAALLVSPVFADAGPGPAAATPWVSAGPVELAEATDAKKPKDTEKPKEDTAADSDDDDC